MVKPLCFKFRYWFFLIKLLTIISRIFFLSVFVILFSVCGYAAKEINFSITVYNKTRTLENATIFVYEEGILVKTIKTNAKGFVEVGLKYDAYYLLSISSPGHYTTTIEIGTKKATPDEVKQVDFPIELLTLGKANAQAQMHFRYKWNPIFGEFQTPQLNLGWQELLYEKNE